MHPAELEILVDRELRRLPAPRAPLTLLPRVMAAVQEWSRRPWYTRAWFSWPVAWQAVSIAVLTLLVAGAVLLLPGAWAAAADTASSLTGGVRSDVAVMVRRAEMTAAAAQILWRAVFEPLARYAFVLVALMCVACAAFGALLNSVILERAVQR
jgi:hypothetical protein